MDVVLTTEEFRVAAYIGFMRTIYNTIQGRKSNIQKNQWDASIEGACAESAVAKAFGVYWDGLRSEPSKGDLGRIEVRATQYKNGSLIVRDNDNEDAIFILVVGKLREFKLVGWIYGWEAKLDKYLKDPTNSGRKKAWFVPQKDLHPIEELKDHWNEVREHLFMGKNNE